MKHSRTTDSLLADVSDRKRQRHILQTEIDALEEELNAYTLMGDKKLCRALEWRIEAKRQRLRRVGQASESYLDAIRVLR